MQGRVQAHGVAHGEDMSLGRKMSVTAKTLFCLMKNAPTRRDKKKLLVLDNELL